MRGKSSAIVLDLNEILDISEHGMSFQSPQQLEFGSDLDFFLDLSENQAYLPASGKVVWSDPTGRTGVSFAKMSGPSLLRLREWLFLNALSGAVNYSAAQGQMAVPEALPEPSPLALEHIVTVDSSADEARSPESGELLSALAAVRQDVEQIGSELELSLQLLAERALILTGASGAAVAISEGAEVVCRASAGFDAPPLGARVQVGSGFSGECLRTGELLLCEDSEVDSRVDLESCRFLGVRSLMACPIRAGQAILGLLEVFSPQPFTFGENEKLVLQSLAEIALHAVRRAVDASAARQRISQASVRFAESHTVGAAAARSGASPIATADSTANADALPHRTFDLTIPLRRVPAWGRIVVLASALVVLSAGAAFFVHASHDETPKETQAAPAQTGETKAPETAFNGVADLQRLAEKGDSTAQFALGAHFATGDGVAQDYSQAAHWFSLAAGQGHVLAQATLGAYYWAGRGVPQDLQKAYFWSALAQSGGDQASKYRLQALASRMPHRDVLAAQKQVETWLSQHSQAAAAPNSGH